MRPTTPARINKEKYKKSLIKQHPIVKMVKRKSFKTVRRLLPIKDMKEMVNKLELDAGSRKINLVNLIKAIFYSVVINNSSSSRSIAKVGTTAPGRAFSGLSPVSHVAILDRLNWYDEEKLDAMICKILDGINAATKRTGIDSFKVRIIDGTSLAFSYNRTKKELPRMGKNKIINDGKVPSKALLKVGITVQGGTFIPLDWKFTDDHDDNDSIVAVIISSVLIILITVMINISKLT